MGRSASESTTCRCQASALSRTAVGAEASQLHFRADVSEARQIARVPEATVILRQGGLVQSSYASLWSPVLPATDGVRMRTGQVHALVDVEKEV
jgi:hypothetical protein